MFVCHLTTPSYPMDCTIASTFHWKARFGLFPFRSPLLRKLCTYVLVFFSSRYWNVLLPWVRILNQVKIRDQVSRVSPFGNLRIKGCLAPPRSVSPLYCVLHRYVVSRHPPYALIFPLGNIKTTITFICYLPHQLLEKS